MSDLEILFNKGSIDELIGQLFPKFYILHVQKFGMVESPVRVVVISEDEHIKNQLEKIGMEFEIERKSFSLDRDCVIYVGHKFFYDRFSERFEDETDLASDILVKKGSDEAPGMYSLGTLQDSEYREIL